MLLGALVQDHSIVMCRNPLVGSSLAFMFCRSRYKFTVVHVPYTTNGLGLPKGKEKCGGSGAGVSPVRSSKPFDSKGITKIGLLLVSFVRKGFGENLGLRLVL